MELEAEIEEKRCRREEEREERWRKEEHKREDERRKREEELEERRRKEDHEERFARMLFTFMQGSPAMPHPMPHPRIPTHYQSLSYSQPSSMRTSPVPLQNTYGTTFQHTYGDKDNQDY